MMVNNADKNTMLIETKTSINLYIDIGYNVCYHIIVANDEYINWKRGIKIEYWNIMVLQK